MIGAPPNTLPDVEALQAKTRHFLDDGLLTEADAALQAASQHMHTFDHAVQSFTMHVNPRDLKSILHGLVLMQRTMRYFPAFSKGDAELDTLLGAIQTALLTEHIEEEIEMEDGQDVSDEEDAEVIEIQQEPSKQRQRIFRKGYFSNLFNESNGL